MVVVCAEAVLGSRLALDSGIVEVAREVAREVVARVENVE